MERNKRENNTSTTLYRRSCSL